MILAYYHKLWCRWHIWRQQQHQEQFQRHYDSLCKRPEWTGQPGWWN